MLFCWFWSYAIAASHERCDWSVSPLALGVCPMAKHDKGRFLPFRPHQAVSLRILGNVRLLAKPVLLCFLRYTYALLTTCQGDLKKLV